MRLSPRPLIRLTAGLVSAAVMSHQALAATPLLTEKNLQAGYGRQIGDENVPVTGVTRDENDNRVIINGLLAQGSGLSGGISSQDLANTNRTISGFGQVSATAIGNNLSIVTNGSWNTIIVNSTQTNTGTVSATASGESGATTNVAR